MATFETLRTIDDIHTALELPNYVVWARLRDRHDCRIYAPEGVRLTEERLQVNAGEYRFGQPGGYLNEEWLEPAFVYLKHQCDDCRYPPTMCCLQPSSFTWIDDEAYLEERRDIDDEIMESDSYQHAEDELQRPHNLLTLIIEE